MNELLTMWNTHYANILITLGISFVFFILGPMGLWFSGKKIKKERTGKAIDLMIDLVEGMIVNQEDITNIKLKKLFGAIEREVNVSIDSAYDLDRLLEDVALRFQRSKHLDAKQKDEYAKRLSELSNSLEKLNEKNRSSAIPRKYSEILNSLDVSIESKNSELIKKSLSELKSKLTEVQINDASVFRMLMFYKRAVKDRPWLLVTALIVYLIIIIMVMLITDISA